MTKPLDENLVGENEQDAAPSQKLDMTLPDLLVSNDTVGRAYNAYRTSSDKSTFVQSIVLALSELNPNSNIAVATQAQAEMWLMERNILSSDEIVTLRADLASKRTAAQTVSDQRERTAQYLAM